MYEKLSEKLKQALKRRNMSQKELAQKLNVTPQAVSKWMCGKSLPSIDLATDILKILGINIIEEMAKADRRKENMRQVDLCELNNYEAARQEAKAILSDSNIDNNYSHSVYILCERLVTAVIGLTYYQMIHNKDKNNDVDYYNIFNNIEDYFDKDANSHLPEEHLTDEYNNYLDYNFFLMGADLFESFDEYKIPNHDYFAKSLSEWYTFKKSINESPSSNIYNELLVALSEIID